MDKPFWYKLIYHWCRRKGRNGLTIPFLIGAQNIILPEKRLIDIETLLNEIKHTPVEIRVVLHHCSDLDEYILGLDQTHSISKYFANFGSFYIGDVESEKIGSFEQIVKFMSDKYSQNINDSLFSKEVSSGTWRPFKESDIQLIRKSQEE